MLEFLSAEIRPPYPILLEMLNHISGQIGEYIERTAAKARPGVEVGAR